MSGAPATKEFSAESLEKKVYNVIEQFSTYIPVINDRYRLGYNLVKYKQGVGDAPAIAVKSAKLNLTGISEKELAEKLQLELDKI